VVFSSVAFLFYFLPVFLFVYYALPRVRNLTLLLGSLIFYAWGEWDFLPLMVASICANYLMALQIDRSTRRRLMLASGIVLNLGVLCIFKYLVFIDQNLGAVFHVSIPGAYHFTRIPLGISFFTFQSISYLVDVYRRNTDAEKNPLNVGTYIAMFPQLVAGPIVRFKTVRDELHHRTTPLHQVATGAHIFILGLSSKLLIADTLAFPADAAFTMGTTSLSTSLAWLGVISYTFQIYFDFAGYSAMAIGLGLMLGFHFPQNFNHPYVAQSVTDFWRRWHISLSTWFRDYLYIPMGGNRGGWLRTSRNLIVVFVLCGLWHGASWNFLLWGVYHGVFLVLERMLKGRITVRFRPLRHLYLVSTVAFGWVLFRGINLTHVGHVARRLFSAVEEPMVRGAGEYMGPHIWIILVLASLLCAFGEKLAPYYFQLIRRREGPAALLALRTTCGLLLLFLCFGSLAANTHSPFIYFNF
jgi:alginate O-acetyltransferase complex protein AlgI